MRMLQDTEHRYKTANLHLGARPRSPGAPRRRRRLRAAGPPRGPAARPPPPAPAAPPEWKMQAASDVMLHRLLVNWTAYVLSRFTSNLTAHEPLVELECTQAAGGPLTGDLGTPPGSCTPLNLSSSCVHVNCKAATVLPS
jgi:hypothetical protein